MSGPNTMSVSSTTVSKARSSAASVATTSTLLPTAYLVASATVGLASTRSGMVRLRQLSVKEVRVVDTWAGSDLRPRRQQTEVQMTGLNRLDELLGVVLADRDGDDHDLVLLRLLPVVGGAARMNVLERRH